VDVIPDLKIPIYLNVAGVVKGIAGKDEAIRLIKEEVPGGL